MILWSALLNLLRLRPVVLLVRSHRDVVKRWVHFLHLFCPKPGFPLGRQKEANSERGTGFSLMPKSPTFLPKLLGCVPLISTTPGNEENHGPASPHHRDPGPTSTDLQEGLIPEGSCRVAAFSPNIIWGSHLP